MDLYFHRGMVWAGAAALACGLLLGILLAGWPSSGASTPAARTASGGTASRVAQRSVPARSTKPEVSAWARSEAEELAVLQRENRRLANENQAVRGKLNDVLSWILQNFRGTYPLPESYFSRLDVPSLQEDFSLHPELADLVRATPEEKEKINDALGTASAILREVELTTSSVRTTRPDKVILTIPSFPEQGRYLRDDLYASIQSALGRDRFDRFLKAGETDLRGKFYEFGEASRTIIFELVDSPSGDFPDLVIRDAYVIPAGEREHEIRARESVVTNLPRGYRPFLAVLPDYMAGYAVP